MNDLIDSVIAFQDFLKKEDIPVTAIGGVAVAVWGEPRDAVCALYTHLTKDGVD